MTLICGFHSLASLDTIPFAEPSGSTTSLAQSLVRSSCSSSTSQSHQSTKALRGRIEYLVHIPFEAVDNWKQRSRFNGWQWGILTGSAICALVLLVNCALVVLGASSKKKRVTTRALQPLSLAARTRSLVGAYCCTSLLTS